MDGMPENMDVEAADEDLDGEARQRERERELEIQQQVEERVETRRREELKHLKQAVTTAYIIYMRAARREVYLIGSNTPE